MNRNFKIAGSALLLATSAAWAQPAATGGSVSSFDRTGASDTQLWGVNDSGQIVGSDSLGGYVLTGGVATALAGPAGSTSVVPFAISDSGMVVGSWTSSDGTVEQGFLYQNGQYTTFDVNAPGVTATEVRHVSLDGRYLTGFYTYGSGSTGGFVFDRTTSALQLITPADTSVIVQGANSAGLVTGSFAPGGALLFDATTGTQTVYASLAGIGGRPVFRDINDAGLITGFAGGQAIVGSIASGFTVLGVPGAAQAYGEGLNNLGEVVGSYNDSNGLAHGFIAAVPEPSSPLMLLAGLGVVGGLLRRKAARHAEASQR